MMEVSRRRTLQSLLGIALSQEVPFSSTQTSSHKDWPQFNRDRRNSSYDNTQTGLIDKPELDLSVGTTGEILASPVVVNDTLYVGGENGVLKSIDTNDGEILWTYETGGVIRTSPAVTDELVIFGCDVKVLPEATPHDVVALDIESGKKRWGYRTNGRTYSSPTVVQDKVYIGSSDQKLYALDAKTGQKEWDAPLPGQAVATAAVSEDLVYTAGGDTIVCFERTAGRRQWEFSTEDYITASPTVDDGTVYIGSWDNYLYALEAQTGELKWKYGSDGTIWSSPAISDQHVIFGSEDKKIRCLTKSGEKRWIHEMDDKIMKAPTITKDSTYIIDTSGLVCALESKTGNKKWEFDSEESASSSPVIVDDDIYFVHGSGTIKSLTTTNDGKIRLRDIVISLLSLLGVGTLTRYLTKS